MQILKPQSAVADFRKVLALEPKNDTVRAQMVATQKLIRKIEFEKARYYWTSGRPHALIDIGTSSGHRG